MLKRIFIFSIFSTSLICYSQTKDTISNKFYVDEPDKIAKEAVAKIMQYTGLTPNFTIIPDNNINTAIAYLKGTKRYIAYNPNFITKLKDKTKTNWAAVSVLAHEIGHHLSGHTLLKESTPGNELIADKFSGFILFEMGAKLNEAMAALSTIGHEMDTTNHPPKEARMAAIKEGWLDAQNLKFKTAYVSSHNTHQDTAVFIYQCQFLGDDNIYFVDDKNNIIWYDNYGKPIIIGKKVKPKMNEFEWIYKYAKSNYGVDNKGKIWKETTYGAKFIVGSVNKIKE